MWSVIQSKLITTLNTFSDHISTSCATSITLGDKMQQPKRFYYAHNIYGRLFLLHTHAENLLSVVGQVEL